MDKRALRRRAYREAATVLRGAMDRVELAPDLSEGDEEYVREYIRHEVADALDKRGREGGTP